MTNKRLALIVANNLYSPESGLSKLVSPPQDADALASVLSNPKIGGFEVQTLKNESSQTVNEAIESLFAESSREDVLLFYFSGHGIKDENGQLYFAVANTRRDRLRSTAIKATQVNEMRLQSRSRRQVLIFDCCHSGAFARGMIAKGDKNIHTQEYFGGGPGVAIMTASDAMQYAFEGEEVNGSATLSIFTRTLIRGLEMGEADLDYDGEVDFNELYEYVYSIIINETPNQSPMKWELGVEGKIIIARNPKPHTPRFAAPGEISTGYVIDGRYKVKSYISRGMMSTLFWVYDQRLNRDMTLNIMAAEWMVDKVIVDRFERGWQILASLSHPSIVHVYDHGVEKGLPFYTMQYLSGETLYERMKKGHLSNMEVRSSLFPVLDAMNYIHQKGIIHRDIKLSSVQYDDTNTPYLIDFNIAKRLSDEVREDESIVGTPAYMSPEQGQGMFMDHRSDLYSFGILLFNCVTGRVPFDEDTPLAIIFKHILDPLPSPRKFNPMVSEEFEKVILKLTEKNPDERYQSATEVKEALSRVL